MITRVTLHRTVLTSPVQKRCRRRCGGAEGLRRGEYDLYEFCEAEDDDRGVELVLIEYGRSGRDPFEDIGEGIGAMKKRVVMKSERGKHRTRREVDSESPASARRDCSGMLQMGLAISEASSREPSPGALYLTTLERGRSEDAPKGKGERRIELNRGSAEAKPRQSVVLRCLLFFVHERVPSVLLVGPVYTISGESCQAGETLRNSQNPVRTKSRKH